VALDIYYSGDSLAGCAFTWDVNWGDGNSSQNLVVTGPPAGDVLLAQHTYATPGTYPGTYTITVSGEATPASSCTANPFTATFTLLAPLPKPPILNPKYSGYTTPFAHNWYAVGGTWHVPSNACQDSPFGVSDASQWVGLGGVGSKQVPGTPLVQLGVASYCVLGKQLNLAVWQVMPPDTTAHKLSPFSYPVHAGDEIFASVYFRGNGNYAMTMVDNNTGWTFRMNYSTGVGVVPTTADWIVEAGTGHLADFGSVTFSGASYSTATTHGILLDGIGSVPPRAFELVVGNRQWTTVSPVAPPGQFTVTYIPGGVG
jgi:Peptidase A4 family